ncbi:ribosomal protein L1 [Corynespora cassiicola Philippines]|uniref:Ribosomal protein L1 n=1 Tax=Corynespora cassiicola Philippines TaxID=1448308 RepID=A0A2T2PBM0_CORCC|nr:ribosomal protein L1 [Corynespora cassiicola Philippines]
MAHPRSFIAPLSRFSTASIVPKPDLPRLSLLPLQSVRCAATKAAPKKKKKARNTFQRDDLKNADQFSLLDAMHYIRAFEVGQNPSSVKYEMHVHLKTLKNGPVIRNRMRLPHPVKTDVRICVIAAPDSKAAAEARAAGATLVGEDEIFNQVKEGIVEFDRCICHSDSLQKLNKAGLGRILGPKGLMPSVKTGTVVNQVGPALKNMVGGSEYRERVGCIRMAVGQLGFTPDEMQRNIKSFIESLKKDIAQLSDRIGKDIHEVVLSSTHSPGFTLSGDFKGPHSIPAKDLSGPL